MLVQFDKYVILNSDYIESIIYNEVTSEITISTNSGEEYSIERQMGDLVLELKNYGILHTFIES